MMRRVFLVASLLFLCGCNDDASPRDPSPPPNGADPSTSTPDPADPVGTGPSPPGPTDDLEPAVQRKLAHARERALAEDTTTAWLHYARVLHAHRMHAEAETAYGTAQAKAGKPKFETLYLAGVCAQYRDPDSAQALFEKALELRRDFAPLRERLADLALARGDWLVAKTHYGTLGTIPTDSEAWRRRCFLGWARVELARGNAEEAKQHLAKFRAPHLTRGVLEALARAEHALGNEEAARAAAAAARTAPVEPPLPDPYLSTVLDEGVSFMNHIAFAVSYERRGELDRALGRLDAALRARPENPDALLMRGRILHRLRRPTEAIEAYQSALRHGAKADEASEGIAGALATSGDPEEADRAKSMLRELLDEQPDRSTALLLLAQLEKRDSPADALPLVARALRLDPLDSSAQRLLSDVLLALDRFDQGTQYLARVSAPGTTRKTALAALEQALAE